MLLRCAIVALVAATAGCAQSISPDAGADAPADAGVDAGRDGDRDAGADAGRRDSSADAGVDGAIDAGNDYDPGWVRLPGLPDECPVERAEHPERVIPLSVWEPCPEQPVGCSRAILRGLPMDLGWHDDERERGYVSTYGDGLRIVDLDRGAIAAWRVRPPGAWGPWACSVHRVGIGDGYGAMYVALRIFGAEDRNRDHIYHAPLDEIGSTTEPIAVIAPGFSSTPQALAVTRRVVLAEMQPVAVVVAFEPDRWGAIWSETIGDGIPQRVRAVGDFAFWLSFAGAPRIAYGSLDQPAAWLRDARPASIRAFDTEWRRTGVPDAVERAFSFAKKVGRRS